MISNSSMMAYNNNRKVLDLENKKDKKIWIRKVSYMLKEQSVKKTPHI